MSARDLPQSVTAASLRAGQFRRRAVIRRWVMGLIGFGFGKGLSASGQPHAGTSPGEPEEIAQVESKARQARLAPFRSSRTEHFLALGDAPDPFRLQALKICEALGQVFLAHFHERGFELSFPGRRLTIITLKDLSSYAAFLGHAPGADVGGHFDLETDRLVIFDFRPEQAELGAQAERVNLFTLVHETAHQLSFNTGLLARESDLPLCITEGLATYVEPWRPGPRNALGGVNKPRLLALRQAGESDDPWIPIGILLTEDQAFLDPKTEQLAYAESWLLVHYLLQSRARVPRLKKYLAAARSMIRQADRAKVVEQSLGALATLDREVKRKARWLLRE